MTQKWFNTLIMFPKLKNDFFKEKIGAILHHEWKPNKNSIKLEVTKLNKVTISFEFKLQFMESLFCNLRNK